MPSNFWRTFGELVDIFTEEESRPREIVIVKEQEPRRREIVIVPAYQEVYPLIRRESFDSGKVEKATKYFQANRAVNIDDLLKCLKSMNFDTARIDLCNALRRPISKMSYFDRMEIADTFDWTSSVPSFLDD